MTGAPDAFAQLAEALLRHAQRRAQDRVREQRGGDARWRSPRLLWPRVMGEE